MEEYEATFVVDSKTDAYAVERLMERLHDTLREELRSIRDGSAESTAVLGQFEAIRTAASHRTPGTLTVRYEQTGEGFDQ